MTHVITPQSFVKTWISDAQIIACDRREMARLIRFLCSHFTANDTIFFFKKIKQPINFALIMSYVSFVIVLWLILTAHYELTISLTHKPTLMLTVVRQQAFFSLPWLLCLALFKLSPFYTNPLTSAKLFHMLLPCPIYSTPTICS